MRHEKLSQALNEVSDTHIAQASVPKRKLKPVWLGTAAAVLAVAVLTVVLTRPMTTSATGLVASPTYPVLLRYSEDNWAAYEDSQQKQYDQPEGYANSALPFFHLSTTTLLSDSGTENAVCSPVNLYMALAMLAQTTGGETRQELLDALGADSVGALQETAGHLWNGHYQNDGQSELVLANSLWLDTAYGYHQDTADILAQRYYASVYRGDLGTGEMDKALRDWLDQQTHGLLREQAQQVTQSDDCLLALASTVYYSVPWQEAFNKNHNADGIFHTPGGDVEVTFLRKDQLRTHYRGENYSAVCEYLRDGSKMWLILPDETISTSQILAEGHALDVVLDTGKPIRQAEAIVHLWLPKFDIAADRDIREALYTLGIRQVQDELLADFSSIVEDQEGVEPYLSDASHAARVSIDEEGVTGAAYTVLQADNAASDPGDPEEIDFILDRPFLFIIESDDGLPLFAGIVNQP